MKSEEGATKCLQRPICEEKHYRKVFTGCDTSDTVNSFSSNQNELNQKFT